MNLKTILLPPNTIPKDWLFRQLLIFFDEIFLYAASEDCCDDDNFYCRNKMVNCYAPQPFDSGLKNFQRLIADIKKNRAEYYSGGLFSLSTMVHNNVDESSVWQLVSKIMTPESQEDQQSKTLLEARLLLRLAEIASVEEEEIDLELNKVNLLTDSLLDELKDEETKKLTTPVLSKIISGNLSKLVRAWSHLFMVDKNSERPWIAATASLEVFEMLSDYYSTQLTKVPIKLFSLSLPDFAAVDDSDEYFIKQRNQFCQSVQGGMQKLKQELQRISQSGGQVNADLLKEAIAIWQEETAIRDESCCTKLDFYLFEGLSLPELFSRITKSTKSLQTSDFPGHGILVVIN